MKKHLFDFALLVALCLLSQWASGQRTGTPQAPDFNAFLNTTLAVSDVRDSRSFAKLFMENAELTDINGNVYLGKSAIRSWHEHLRASCAGAQTGWKLLNRHTRLLRPDLLVLVAALELDCHGQYSSQIYHCLFRKIDGEWLVETCSIIPVSETSDARQAVGYNR